MHSSRQRQGPPRALPGHSSIRLGGSQGQGQVSLVLGTPSVHSSGGTQGTAASVLLVTVACLLLLFSALTSQGPPRPLSPAAQEPLANRGVTEGVTAGVTGSVGMTEGESVTAGAGARGAEGTRVAGGAAADGQTAPREEATPEVAASDEGARAGEGEGPGVPPPPQRPRIGRCPAYFSFVQEDLEPWARRGGITWEAVNGTRDVDLQNPDAIKTPSFFALILSGKLYYEDINDCMQTRKQYSLWGFLELLERYPGQVPDVAFMFYCWDEPHVRKWPTYQEAQHPPLQFQYCNDAHSIGLVFPDWTFWGWEELQLPPWHILRARILGNASLTPWDQRLPRAHWKGTVFVKWWTRGPMVGCGYRGSPWAIDAYEREWGESAQNKTALEYQCRHKYKVYAEGVSWSVSIKYILACGSVPLFLEPIFYDFFSRALERDRDWLYLPNTAAYRPNPFCQIVNDTVEALERDIGRARAMAERIRRFMEEDMSMDMVYDYMLYVLKEYAKLQKFVPSKVPRGNVTLASKAALSRDYPFLTQYPPFVSDVRRPCFE